jgi:hypothetical protein
MCIFTYGFNTTVLHHITLVKCVSMGISKLSWMPDLSWTWSCNFLARTLTWLECSRLHSMGLFENQYLCHHIRYKRGIVALNSTNCKRNQEYICEGLYIHFPHRAELCVRDDGSHFEHHMKVKIDESNSSFECSLLTCNQLNWGKIYLIGTWTRDLPACSIVP